MPPDVSVIFVTWNALAVATDALRTLREQTAGVTYETFVVDNGTTKDATPTELPARFPWATYILNPDNRGFSAANNQAVRQAAGRYVLLLNTDTVQTHNAVGEAVRYMDAHPEVGALGVLHRNADPGRTYQPSHFPFPRPAAEIAGLLLPARPAPPAATAVPPEQDVDWVTGSFLMVRRACLDQVGPLDEDYFIYDEDIDWCRRVRRAGWKVRFWPGAELVHLGSQANPFMRDKTLVMFRSHITYLRKNHGPAASTAYYAAMATRLGLALAKQTLRWAAGTGSRAEVRQRWGRLTGFVGLKPTRAGI